MKPGHPRDERNSPHDERAAEVGAREPRAKDAPAAERRASHRVSDDQKSGQGSMSALSKLKMLERKRAAMKPGHDES